MSIQIEIEDLDTETLVLNQEDEEEMAGAEHGEISILISWRLAEFVYPKKLGRVFDGQTTFRIGGTPPTRRPDVAFVKMERMPERTKDEVPFPPDLAVEVISPTDSSDEVDEKIIQYQEAGVSLIWLVRPTLQIVEVFRPETGLLPQAYGLRDELDGSSVLPGFKLPVAALFEY